MYIYIYIHEHKNLLKLQIFSYFSEALTMYNKVKNEDTDNSAT